MGFQSVPFDKKSIDDILEKSGIPLGTASIREMNRIINTIEKQLNVRYIRMEFGIPGLPVNPIAIEAEIEALRNNLAHIYPPFDGIPLLKEATKDFIKAFMNFDVPSHCCVPTNGSMQGGFISMGLAGRRFPERDTILFLDPGFPVNKLQCKVWGYGNDSIDLYDHRGDKLLKAVEERFATGKIGGIMYNSPNNPSWVVLKEYELEGIGKLCSRYRVMAIEDLAYFGMDFRHDYGIPHQPPYQPTVAHYTDQYIVLISSSKMFSYAGQRIAMAIISPNLFNETSKNLLTYFGTDNLGHAFVHGGMYPMTSGVSHSSQYGLAALLRASVNGQYKFTDFVREYERRAKGMKKAFLNNGFTLVYDNDLGEPLADGFYFTVAYPGRDGCRLLEELVYYGVSAISLVTTGSSRTEGIRACVSLTKMEDIPELTYRLETFHHEH